MCCREDAVWGLHRPGRPAEGALPSCEWCNCMLTALAACREERRIWRGPLLPGAAFSLRLLACPSSGLLGRLCRRTTRCAPACTCALPQHGRCLLRAAAVAEWRKGSSCHALGCIPADPSHTFVAVQGKESSHGQALGGTDSAFEQRQGLGEASTPQGQQDPRVTPHPAFDQNVRTPVR